MWSHRESLTAQNSILYINQVTWIAYVYAEGMSFYGSSIVVDRPYIDITITSVTEFNQLPFDIPIVIAVCLCVLLKKPLQRQVSSSRAHWLTNHNQ